ncbi:hypothetical protein C8J56DRAFT_933078 [Mycena floridula]|nr:hypothetical protein C8J56DRAFT_933078 [Mycena floridula]
MFLPAIQDDRMKALAAAQELHKALHLKIGDPNRLQSLVVDTLQQVSDVNRSASKPFPLCLDSFTQALELVICQCSVISEPHQHDEYELRRSTQKSYFTAITDFLTSYKSDDDLERILQDWKPCRCDITDTAIHQCHISCRRWEVIWVAVAEMITDLSKVLVSVMKMRESDVEGQPDSELWPIASQNLLHSNAAEAVAAAKQWLKRTKVPSGVFTYLTALCEFHSPAFNRAILGDPDLLERATFHFERMVLHHDAQHPQLEDGYIDITIMIDRESALLSGLRFFQALTRTQNSSENTLYFVCLPPYARRIYDTLVALHSILPEEYLSVQNPVSSLAFQIYLLIPDELLPVMHPALRSPFSYVYERLTQSPLPGICMNPGCQLAASYRCTGCRVVCYCTRECQRAAWKASMAPHNQICKYFKSFVSLLTREDGVVVIREQYEARAVASGMRYSEAIKLLKKLKELDAALGVNVERK